MLKQMILGVVSTRLSFDKYMQLQTVSAGLDLLGWTAWVS